MTCPTCSATVPQKRADGRCVVCGKLLPLDLRGAPDALPRTAVASAKLLAGDIVEMHGLVRRGDIVVLLAVHRERFAIVPVTPTEAATYSGPKYISPMDMDGVPFPFVMNGWEE